MSGVRDLRDLRHLKLRKKNVFKICFIYYFVGNHKINTFKRISFK